MASMGYYTGFTKYELECFARDKKIEQAKELIGTELANLIIFAIDESLDIILENDNKKIVIEISKAIYFRKERIKSLNKSIIDDNELINLVKYYKESLIEEKETLDFLNNQFDLFSNKVKQSFENLLPEKTETTKRVKL